MQQKQQPIEVTLIGRYVDMIGYSYLFPKGEKVFIQKKVVDHKNGVSVYQGHFFNSRNQTCVDMQFDGVTGIHNHFVANEYDEKGAIIHRPSAYCVKIDVDQFG